MTYEPRPVQVDLLAQPWYAHENDLIGGWSVLNVDCPPSQADHRADQYAVGNFLGEDTARHIAALHNEHLGRAKVPPADKGWLHVDGCPTVEEASHG